MRESEPGAAAPAEPEPQDILHRLRLMPKFSFIGDPMRSLDHSFALNALVRDVNAVLRKTQHCNARVVNSSMQPSGQYQYLLDYLGRQENVITVKQMSPLYAGADGELFEAPMPIEPLEPVWLFLDPADFEKELNTRINARGIPGRWLILNDRLEQLPASASFVGAWTAETQSSTLYLVPTALKASPSTPQEEFSDAPERPRDKCISIELREGLTLNVAGSLYDLDASGFLPDPAVTKSLRDFLGTCSGSAGEDSMDVSLATLGRGIRAQMGGSSWLEDLKDSSDEAVAQRALADLQSSAYQKELSYLLACEVAKLKKDQQKLAEEAQLAQQAERAHQVERAQQAERAQQVERAPQAERDGRIFRFRLDLRIPPVPNRVAAAWRMGLNASDQLVNLILYLGRMELTMVVLYSFFWILLINILQGTQLAKIPVAIYLVLNVFLCVLRIRWHIDVVDILLARLLPKIYPENPAVSLSKETVREAAARLNAGDEVDYNKIVDSLIVRPSVLQALSISVFCTMPSVLSKWHSKVDQQRHKTREAVVAAVEIEKNMITAAPSDDAQVSSSAAE